MKVTIIHGNTYISHEMSEVPLVGEDVRIAISGAAPRDIKVLNRRWIFSPGRDPEVTLNCA